MHKAKDSPPHWEETAVFSLAGLEDHQRQRLRSKPRLPHAGVRQKTRERKRNKRRRTKENLEGGKEELEDRGSEGKRR